MTEERTTHDAGQPVDRLGEINVTTASQSDVLWLIAEVERLRQRLRDIGLNTKITLERNHPQDMANFLREVELMTREWAE